MQPISRRRWQLRQNKPQPELVSDLARLLRINPLTAQILVLRGISDVSSGDEFLRANLSCLPDPDLLPDMRIACQRIELALMRGERIAIHGDYDVDGISGCSLLVEVLRKLGAEVEYHIPLRLVDGYGLSAEALRKAAEHGCSLAISVDCGVSAVAEAELAAGLGLDLIITDHHQPPDQLPRCLALINPHLSGCRFPWRELSGVGVAFFLLAGLRRRLRENGYFESHPEPDLRQSLDLVALGTIADIVPLGGVNRILTRSGLQLMERDSRPGLTALKQVADVKQVTSGVVGFRLAPRLNAAGRLEDAALGVQLLLNEDGDLTGLASLLDGFNRERQLLEQKTLQEACRKVEDEISDDSYSIVLAGEDWHPGVIGIVASRLVERYHRPVVMLAVDGEQAKGSARSIKGFHLHRGLQDCAGQLSAFGGHEMAAGMSLEKCTIDAFRSSFELACRSQLQEDDLVPVALHDGEVELGQITREWLAELELLNPCGAGNPQPAFVSQRCRILDARVLADKHLKFSVEQQGLRVDCIAFGMAERYAELAGCVDLLYRPGLNSWRGTTSVQLQVMDFR